MDQWLDFAWTDLEVPLQVFAQLKSEGGAVAGLTAEEKAAVEAKSRQDITAALATLERHLEDKTYLVGEKISLADLSLACAMAALSKLSLLDAIAFPSVLRWLMTSSTHPKVRAILGDLSSCTISESGDYSFGKWTRRRIRVKELLKEGVSPEKNVIADIGNASPFQFHSRYLRRAAITLPQSQAPCPALAAQSSHFTRESFCV